MESNKISECSNCLSCLPLMPPVPDITTNEIAKICRNSLNTLYFLNCNKSTHIHKRTIKITQTIEMTAIMKSLAKCLASTINFSD